MRNLSLRILEMIREGLGLKCGYVGDVLTGVQMFSVNYNPPCTDPSLALGAFCNGVINVNAAVERQHLNAAEANIQHFCNRISRFAVIVYREHKTLT
nr:hypothetical protein [Tanacetum cinerariifolium]